MSSYNRYEADRYQKFRKGDSDDAGFLSRFIRNSNFLDAGCGTGNDLLQIYERTGWKGFGCDASVNMLTVAQRRRCSQDLKMADLDSQFPFENLFDTVYIMDVIHHLRAPHVFIQNAFHHLNSRGYLLIGTESEYDLRHKLLTRYFPEILEKDLQRYHPIGRIIDWLIGAKFRAININHIDEEVPITAELITLFENKAFSILRLISEDAFQKGITTLKHDLEEGILQNRPKLYTYITAQKL